MSKKYYKIGLVGIGVVGTEMIKVLRERNFPIDEIRIMARSAREEEIAGEKFQVVMASLDAFNGLDFAFFAGTEGAKGASRQYGWDAVAHGVTVIDNGDDFRMDSRVPLIIPEVNGHVLGQHQGFIANPNCSTIVALMALGPLHKAFRIKRIIVSTYQSVSGSGSDAVIELNKQIKAIMQNRSIESNVYPHQIAHNVIPQIGSLKVELPGYTSEEAKMYFETRKILEDETIRVSATCVRVPTFYAHAEAVNVEFSMPISPKEACKVLDDAKGVVVIDNPEKARYPMPIVAEGSNNVYVGRIRADDSTQNGLAFFVVGDNIRKGAALNAVQIAEALIL